jgi:hypothetical protein
MTGDLTRRLYTAANGATPEETARAVTREIARWLREEAALYAARNPGRLFGADDAHHSAIEQIADHLDRVGDERHPA